MVEAHAQEIPIAHIMNPEQCYLYWKFTLTTLAQRAMGHMPPVCVNKQSPQPRHISLHTPGSSDAPINVVFNAGMTGNGSNTCDVAPLPDSLGNMPQYLIALRYFVLQVSGALAACSRGRVVVNNYSRLPGISRLGIR